MRYNSEVDVKEKDTFLRFLAAMPEIDKEVALQFIGQIPEITMFAKAALEDAAKAYDGLLASNARSIEMGHQIRMARLAILKTELENDLSPKERMRVLDDIRDVHASADLKETENKKFLSEQFEKRLGAGLIVASAIAAVVLSVAKSGGTHGRGANHLYAA